MKQILFKIIYNGSVNYIIRSVTKLLHPILPSGLLIPPSGTISIKNDTGEKLRIKTNQSSYITKFIFWNGGYKSFEYTSIFIVLIRRVNTFFDIGANIGYYSLLASMENPKIGVVGFEPAKGPLFFYKQNVLINRFSNIKVESIALSHEKGEIEFFESVNLKYKYLKHNLGGESNAGGKKTDKHFIRSVVKATTLDDYISKYKYNDIDLIKMDTEGTEHLILSKAHIVLSKMKPIIICETLYNSNEEKLESIMKSYGYDFYNHTLSGLQKVDTIIRVRDDGVRNCFFVHPTKLPIIEDFLVK